MLSSLRFLMNYILFHPYLCINSLEAMLSTFAVLLMAINTKDKHVYVVDEIYEKKQAETSVGRLWPRIQAMVNKHCLQDRFKVQYVSDEREAWWINEVRDQFRQQISPTRKHLNKKHEGIGLIRDLMLFEKIHISQDCVSHLKEIQEYARDSKGNIPKKNDHSIDCLRYGLGHANYTVVKPDIKDDKVKVLPNIYIERDVPQANVEMENFLDIDSGTDWFDW